MTHTYNPLETSVCVHQQRYTFTRCLRCDGRPPTDCNEYVGRPEIRKTYRQHKPSKIEIIRSANDGEGWEHDLENQQ